MKRAIGVLAGSLLILSLPQSVSAHGGGPEAIVSFAGIVNWLHFVATAIWLGGIVALRFVVLPSIRGTGPESRRLMQTVSFRFSNLVWWCIGALAITGLLTTWVHVPTAGVFTGTAYGIILILKLAIAAGMVVCNAVISLDTARRWQAGAIGGAAKPTDSRWNPERRVALASRLSLVLAVLMMVGVAALVEFDRSPFSLSLNFLRLSGLTVWFGTTVFVPLVLSPSIIGVDRAYLVRVNAGILYRFGNLALISAMVVLVATALTLAKNLEALSDLWTTGYGIASLLELATLMAMGAVLAVSPGSGAGLSKSGRSRQNATALRIVTSRTMGRAVSGASVNLVLGLGALLFSSLSGALYSPANSTLAADIPTAASSISLDWLEPLGYVLAGMVALALIWYFGVVEGKVRRSDEERQQPPADLEETLP